MLRFPKPPFEHLLRLSDGIGVFEHARNAVPNRENGYCTDDVARALVVVLREQSRPAALDQLAQTCLAFLESAQLPDGRFHNRLAAQPEAMWIDEVGSDDSIGRALWALGSTAARGPTEEIRRRALIRFEAGAGFRSQSPRASAAAVLGGAEVLTARPGHRDARTLVMVGATALGVVSPDPAWPWPEARLAYDNSRLAEGRIAAGVVLSDRRLLDEGLLLLDWLVETETKGDHFSFTPPHGWEPAEPRPGLPQQPIEAGAMADACARAFDATGDLCWASAVLRAAEWFLGNNDAGVPLLDAATGGCHDALALNGFSANEGAESTLALISALQHARRLQAAGRSAASSSVVTTLAAPTHRSAAP